MQHLTLQRLLRSCIASVSEDSSAKRAMILKVMVYLLTSTFNIGAVEWTDDDLITVPDDFDVDIEFDRFVDGRRNASCQEIQSRATDLCEYTALLAKHHIQIPTSIELNASSMAIMNAPLPPKDSHPSKLRYIVTYVPIELVEMGCQIMQGEPEPEQGPEVAQMPTSIEACHELLAYHRKKDLERLERDQQRDDLEKTLTTLQLTASNKQVHKSPSNSRVDDPDAAGPSNAPATNAPATKAKSDSRSSREKPDDDTDKMGVEMYTTLKDNARTRIDAVSRHIVKEGLDLDTSTGIKKIIALHSEVMIKDSMKETDVKADDLPKNYTQRWSVRFRHVRPVKSLTHSTSSSGKSKYRTFLGIEHVPCDDGLMVVRVLEPLATYLPVILQIRRKNRKWKTYFNTENSIEFTSQVLKPLFSDAHEFKCRKLLDVGMSLFEGVSRMKCYEAVKKQRTR